MFTTSSAGNLWRIEIPVTTNTLLSDSVTAGIYTDHLGTPDTLLEEWNFALLAGGSAPPLTTLTSASNTSLAAGTTYWFVVDAGLQGIDWELNNQGVNGGIWAGTGLGELTQRFPSSAAAAIEVDGLTEPGSAMLCAMSILLLVALRFKLRQCRTQRPSERTLTAL
jgi:hypothetical protein